MSPREYLHLYAKAITNLQASNRKGLHGRRIPVAYYDIPNFKNQLITLDKQFQLPLTIHYSYREILS